MMRRPESNSNADTRGVPCLVRQVAAHVQTRDSNMVRSKAQKYFIKLFRANLPLPAKVGEPPSSGALPPACTLNIYTSTVVLDRCRWRRAVRDTRCRASRWTRTRRRRGRTSRWAARPVRRATPRSRRCRRRTRPAPRRRPSGAVQHRLAASSDGRANDNAQLDVAACQQGPPEGRQAAVGGCTAAGHGRRRRGGRARSTGSGRSGRAKRVLTRPPTAHPRGARVGRLPAADQQQVRIRWYGPVVCGACSPSQPCPRLLRRCSAPHTLIRCKQYGQPGAEPEPFRVSMSAEGAPAAQRQPRRAPVADDATCVHGPRLTAALLVADLHAHLLADEVIGFCAGTLAAVPNRGTVRDHGQDRAPRRAVPRR